MIYFDTYAHAEYAKNMCKSHSLLRSQDTIVDFFPNPQQPQPKHPPSPSQQSTPYKKVTKALPFPPKQFEQKKFTENPGSFRYGGENPDMYGSQHEPVGRQSHPESSNKMFLYKPESPSRFVNPSNAMKPTPSFPESRDGGSFRPNRSRPSFSDNASLEQLYSFFSSLFPANP
jgi:hypothetical protein